MLEVTVYESPTDEQPQVFEEVDYVSLVSNGTYGPPALVAPARDASAPRAAIGERVLYINTNFVPLFEIMRVSD